MKNQIAEQRFFVVPPKLERRLGFTLIELLIVVGIIILIASMTVAAVNLNANADKVRAASRQLQSYLAGARDRAIYSREPRGVRLLLEPTNNPSDTTKKNRVVSSMIYIAPTPAWRQGMVQLERLDTNNDGQADEFNDPAQLNPDVRVIRGFDNDPNNPSATDWVYLYKQGLLINRVTRIRIPADDGEWYTIDNVEQLENASPPGFSGQYVPPRLRLTVPYSRSGTTFGREVRAFNLGTGPQTYLLELEPTVLSNQDPVLLPKGTVIHLDRCSDDYEQQNSSLAASGRGNKLPNSWKVPSTTSPADPSGFDYKPTMDIMFSPRGVVIGPSAQKGIIHFYLADRKDADRDRLYWSTPSSFPTASAPEDGIWSDPSSNGYVRGDKVLLSLFTRTGAISTHHVFSNADPFRFAETGEVAAK